MFRILDKFQVLVGYGLQVARDETDLLYEDPVILIAGNIKLSDFLDIFDKSR